MPRQRRAVRQLRGLAVDLAPLRQSRSYRLLWSGQLVSTVGRQITVVALPYQVYLLTRSAFAVGALGLVSVGPLVAVSLLGGTLADRYDRRTLLLLTQVLLMGCSTVLAVGAFLGPPPLALLYTMAAVAAGVSAVDQPARAATVPNLVRPEHLSAAISLNFALFQTAIIAGPSIGGLVIARLPLGTAYTIDAVTFLAALAAVAALPPQPPWGGRQETPLAAIRRGLAFTLRQQAIAGGFAVDLVAMIFGMRRALFPVLAATTLHTGPGGLGLLYAAPGVGAVLGTLSTGWIGRAQRQGTVVVVTAAIWGTTVIGLGFATSLWVALLLLAAGGAADSYSAVSRGTIMQTVAPDELRGRVSAVYGMVVVGGPLLGDVEAGTVATLASPQVSIVSGGVLCVAGVAAVAALMPGLARYRASSTAAIG